MTTPPTKPAVERHDKPGYPPSYTNNGVKYPVKTSSKRRLNKMMKLMKQNMFNPRITNKLKRQHRQEQDLLMRDARRGHHTTRIKRALRRAAQQPTEPTNEGTKE